VTALGNNAHIFARPQRREMLTWCFETVLACGPVATVNHPGIAEPMLVVRFPGGGHLTGHPHYFMASGGQVFTIAPASSAS
jgi:hypothetical protein